MTVEELIELLSMHPSELEVHMRFEPHGDYVINDVYETEDSDEADGDTILILD